MPIGRQRRAVAEVRDDLFARDARVSQSLRRAVLPDLLELRCGVFDNSTVRPDRLRWQLEAGE
ncbi:hypothetical protein [Nocardia sp. BMG51109]|uniref:hypothetical protein n=1 Tax=Nocardia sp. BMG51109 TaxID=1056816 RepID=UPI0018DCEF47|nr:hypothetical protein [Nocardia sp. BMG51109]